MERNIKSILIICSKSFYHKIEEIKKVLEQMQINVELPNCYDTPSLENEIRGTSEHAKFKKDMYKRSEEVISKVDAVLVLNFEKNGVSNYIGGATFLEMYDAFRMNKKIYLYNDIPEGMLKDEIIGFSPIYINQNLEKIK